MKGEIMTTEHSPIAELDTPEARLRAYRLSNKLCDMAGQDPAAWAGILLAVLRMASDVGHGAAAKTFLRALRIPSLRWQTEKARQERMAAGAGAPVEHLEFALQTARTRGY